MLAISSHVCGAQITLAVPKPSTKQLLRWPYLLLLLLNFGCSRLVLLVGLRNRGTLSHKSPKATIPILVYAVLSLLFRGKGRRCRHQAWTENCILLVSVASSIHGDAAGTLVVIYMESGGRERNTKPAKAFISNVLLLLCMMRAELVRRPKS